MAKAKLKDHREIGQEQELFFTHEVAPGAVFWLPRGMVIFKELEKYIRDLTEKAGYQETSTPIMVKSQLFKQSGHWDKFGVEPGVKEAYGGHGMYNLPIYSDEEIEEHKKAIEEKQPHPDLQTIELTSGERIHMPIVNYTLKPMNCPESTLLFRFRTRSYKELPLRLSEIGRLFRREKSGEIGGLLRVRQLTMDDAHIYATEDQILDEVANILDTMMKFYENFGFEYEFRLATRPETRAGTDEMWNKAEKKLLEALKRKGIKAGEKLGDGAFYGPKIDMHIKDAQEREWQLATVQLDLHQPQAFNLKYIDSDGKEKQPVMIHRAIFGSFERFIGMLIEHYQGAFPLWLSPLQISVIPVTDRNTEYAQNVANELKKVRVRVEVDARSETMQARIRDAELAKVPYIIVIGDKEEKEKTIAVRTRGRKDIRTEGVESFIAKITDTIGKRDSELV